jgi:AcrR family transcriptional regulator
MADATDLGGIQRRSRGRPRDPGVDEAILSAVLDLLAEGGYTRLTMDQVAIRAGVGKASVYLRWPNKVALVADAIQRRPGFAPKVPDTGSLREDMLEFLHEVLRMRGTVPRALGAVHGEIMNNIELRRAWRRGMAGTLTSCVREIVERAIERGELPPSADVELLSMLPMALLQNWRLEHEYTPGENILQRIVDQFYNPDRAS